MAYSMCGVESRFCDDAMPIRSGSRILPCAGFVSAVRTIDLRQSALLCQVCVWGVRFPLSSLISGLASGTFFDETGRLTGKKLLCAACAARNAAVSALQGTVMFRSISTAELGSSSSRRTPFTLTANASYRHHVCGSELRRCLLIFRKTAGLADRSRQPSKGKEFDNDEQQSGWRYPSWDRRSHRYHRR